MSEVNQYDTFLLSQAVQALRVSAGITVQKLAEDTLIDVQSLKSFEKGQSSLTQDELQKLIRKLELESYKGPSEGESYHSELRDRVVKQNEDVRFLSKHPYVTHGDVRGAVELICETIASTLKTEYTGIWLLNEKRDFLEAIDEYVLSTTSHEPEDHYSKDDFPEWFEEFEDQRSVISDSVINDEDDEFTGERKKWDIAATIDTCIVFEGDIVGVVSNEDTSRRQWQTDEVSFHTQIADLVSRVLTNKKNKELETKLAEQKDRIKRQQHTIMDIIHHPSLISGDIKEAFEFICLRVSELYDCSISIGLVEGDGRVIRYHSSFDNDIGKMLVDLSSFEMNLNEFKLFESALLKDRVVASSDAKNDTVYSELNSAGLLDQYVVSMVDAAIRDGDKLVGLITVESSRYKEWQPDELVFIGEVTEQISSCLANQQFRRTEYQLNMLSRAVESSSSALFVANEELIVEYSNGKAEQFFATKNNNLKDINVREINIVEESSSNFVAMFSALSAKKSWQGELEIINKQGGKQWVLVSVSPVNVNGNRVSEYVFVCDDVSDLKAAHKEVEQMAFYDALTGLVNRRLFKERLDQSMLAAQRYDTQLAILFLDLDRFKVINDTLGHESGDVLLKGISQRLKECVRESDTVARLGGDEFTVLLTEVDGRDDVATVAKKIITSIREPITLEDETISVTTSVGISLFPDDSSEPSQLMKMADMAMYHAKTKGRNAFEFYYKELDIFSKERLGLEHDLRQALKKDQFIVHYQPIIDAVSGSISSLEALIRWNHPTNGMVPPLKFIPLAEDIGIINDIGNWVMLQACMDLNKLHQINPGLKIAVNLSASQFNAPNFIDKVTAALTSSGVAGEFLVLEITESMLIHDVEHSIAVLEKVREQGVSISIDDFGTGYSSLGYLKRLPVDNIKIDRSFVQHIHTDQHDRDLTTAVIDMAHSLNLSVVAEGIEQKEQADILSLHNCEFFQGFLYAKPCGIEPLADLLKAGRLNEMVELSTVS